MIKGTYKVLKLDPFWLGVTIAKNFVNWKYILFIVYTTRLWPF